MEPAERNMKKKYLHIIIINIKFLFQIYLRESSLIL